jgi:hypothetical protein
MKQLCVLLIVLQWNCNPPVQYSFEGKWQSLNTPETVVEFTAEKEIILLRNKISLWGSATKHGELTYKFTSIQGDWYHFNLLDRDELFVKGRIETVDENRIRIYFYKHHDILDVADEYYRTDGFDNYQVIMDKILMEK